mmetsp:Transcript_5692/g.10859  ORF Transcript_5692/g.10859 Transcript_5692/m.10859 type:complete len:341 (-) Transcript_5692:98-1120(-)|eukprot:CAMPEP_0175123640 /NCGR_PEP_ID=MMETSP0087-20121206/2352_1 /TAXON_ID=136419 /ORGANISM="Unknown Unknown, Strain D1" /LENGTH=340 /DNA_ID=CAMNT_0016405347 /DNA_START=72 /DNA_END=1094 /DNA_ORIENTATION=+
MANSIINIAHLVPMVIGVTAATFIVCYLITYLTKENVNVPIMFLSSTIDHFPESAIGSFGLTIIVVLFVPVVTIRYIFLKRVVTRFISDDRKRERLIKINRWLKYAGYTGAFGCFGVATVQYHHCPNLHLSLAALFFVCGGVFILGHTYLSGKFRGPKEESRPLAKRGSGSPRQPARTSSTDGIETRDASSSLSTTMLLAERPAWVHGVRIASSVLLLLCVVGSGIVLALLAEGHMKLPRDSGPQQVDPDFSNNLSGQERAFLYTAACLEILTLISFMLHLTSYIPLFKGVKLSFTLHFGVVQPSPSHEKSRSVVNSTRSQDLSSQPADPETLDQNRVDL